MSLSLVSLSSSSAQGNGFLQEVCLLLLPTPTPLKMQFFTHVGGRLLTDPFHHLSRFLWLTASLLTIICLRSCPVLLNLSLSVYFLRWRLQYESTMICLRSCPVQFSHLKTWVNHVEVMHTSANFLLLNFPLSRANTWKPESTSLGHHYSLRLFCKTSCGWFHQNYLRTQLSLAQQDCIDHSKDLNEH